MHLMFCPFRTLSSMRVLASTNILSQMAVLGECVSGACARRPAGEISHSQQTAAQSQKTQVLRPKIEASPKSTSPITSVLGTHARNTLSLQLNPISVEFHLH